MKHGPLKSVAFISILSQSRNSNIIISFSSTIPEHMVQTFAIVCFGNIAIIFGAIYYNYNVHLPPRGSVTISMGTYTTAHLSPRGIVAVSMGTYILQHTGYASQVLSCETVLHNYIACDKIVNVNIPITD